MKKMNNIMNWLLGGLILIYLSIIIFPQFLFANKLEYKNFSVYYHSNDVNIDQLKLILDKSEQLIQNSELFNSDVNQSLFICSSFNEFTFFSLLARKAFAVNYPITQNIFLSKSSISEDFIFRNGKHYNKRTLSGVIAHETTHSLLENYLGIIQYKLLPNWKNEGYCDFIANESSYNEQEGIIEICNEKADMENSSFKYYKYRLFTNFLFQENNISVDKFLTEDFDLDKLNQDLTNTYCTQQ